jgi:hypothetical protein
MTVELAMLGLAPLSMTVSAPFWFWAMLVGALRSNRLHSDALAGSVLIAHRAVARCA